jgi:hypothetical protein
LYLQANGEWASVKKSASHQAALVKWSRQAAHTMTGKAEMVFMEIIGEGEGDDAHFTPANLIQL